MLFNKADRILSKKCIHVHCTALAERISRSWNARS